MLGLTGTTDRIRRGAVDAVARARDVDAERAAFALILGAILLAAAVAVSPCAVDPDLWGHVRYGRDLLRDGMPTHATYTYTAQDYLWVNHENLSEIVLAGVADAVGARGLLLGKCLLGVLMIWSIVRAALKKRIGLAPIACAALLVAVNLSYHWSARPQVLGFVCFAALASLLGYSFAGWEGSWRLGRLAGDEKLPYSSRRMKALWLAPLIFAIWTNAHGGFLAGLCIYTAYLGLRGIEAWTMLGRGATGLTLRFGLMIVVAWLASLLNPYGPTLLSWLVADIWAPRPEILDWRAPGLFDPLYLPLWIMAAVAAAALAFSKRSRDFTQLAILAIVFWQATQHQRHIPFFAILFGYWLPTHIESALGRLRSTGSAGFSRRKVRVAVLSLWTTRPGGRENRERARRQEPCLAAQCLRKTQPHGASSRTHSLLVAAAMLGVYALLLVKLAGRLIEMPVPKNEYPVAAMQFIADNELHGKAVVAFNWAQYAIEAVGPSRPGAGDGLLVACDGRLRTCYPQEIIDYHFDFFLGPGGEDERYRDPSSPAFDAARTLRYGHPDLVLLDRRQPNATRTMADNGSDWRLMYQDRLAQLWGRASVYDDPASDYYLPASRRQISDHRQMGAVAWPALPVKH